MRKKKQRNEKVGQAKRLSFCRPRTETGIFVLKFTTTSAKQFYNILVLFFFFLKSPT